MLALAIVTSLLAIVVAYLFYNYLQHSRALSHLSAEIVRLRSDVDGQQRIVDAITPSVGEAASDDSEPPRKRKRSRRP